MDYPRPAGTLVYKHLTSNYDVMFQMGLEPKTLISIHDVRNTTTDMPSFLCYMKIAYDSYYLSNTSLSHHFCVIDLPQETLCIWKYKSQM